MTLNKILTRVATKTLLIQGKALQGMKGRKRLNRCQHDDKILKWHKS